MYRHTLTQEQYDHLLSRLQDHLSCHSKVLFAYLHGSIIDRENFGDIDIAVYFDAETEKELWPLETDLEEEIKKLTGLPVDVRSLNNAPIPFRYSVIKKGLRLADKNENFRVDFESATLSMYFDFLPFRKRYFKDVLDIEI